VKNFLKRGAWFTGLAVVVGSLSTPAIAQGALTPGPSPELLIQQIVPQASVPTIPLAVLGTDFKLPQFTLRLGPADDPLNMSKIASWRGGGCITVQTCASVIEAWSIRNGQRVDFTVSRFAPLFISPNEPVIQFANRTSADPVDAGVLPGDQLNFRIQPGAFTIPNQPVIDTPVIRYDFVLISSTYGGIGVNAPAATETGGVVIDYAASQAPQASPVSAAVPYEGPLNVRHSASTFCAGADAVLLGQRLESIKAVTVAGKEVAFQLSADGSLSYSLADVAPGRHQVRLSVPANSLFLLTQVQVVACSNAAGESDGSRVNVGSFNGKLIVYALGLDQSRITWKVGGIWGQDFASGNTLNRFDRLTPRRGITVTVDIFVDGKRQLTKTVLTR
jgi:hypothetical protein